MILNFIITEVCETTENDPELQRLIHVIEHSWPEKDNLESDLKKYFSLRDTLSVESGPC